MSSVLRFNGVSVARGGNDILSDIDWEVGAGQRWAVLGPNGAGKSTLLALAAGRLHPTSGTVTVLGSELGKVDVFDLRPLIGLVGAAVTEQIPGSELVLDVVVTAAWSIAGRWRETYDPGDLSRAQVLLSEMGVDALADRRFDTLSEGERKRVLIARARMTDPELLLLDEPAAGLDLGAREDLITRLARLAKDPHAPVSVLVTHHVEEIPPGTTDVLLLRAGRVVVAGGIGASLTSANLSAAFDLDLAVTRSGGRWTARAW